MKLANQRASKKVFLETLLNQVQKMIVYVTCVGDPHLSDFFAHHFREKLNHEGLLELVHTVWLVLVVRDAFLKKFEHRYWEEILPGRIAVLRLRGSKGNLDIFCVYLSATCEDERLHGLQRIAAAVRPTQTVCSILFGDFNFTDKPEIHAWGALK